MRLQPFTLEVSPERIIRGDIRIPEEPAGKPAVIFCHGVKGCKDWGGWPYALEKICCAGFYTVAFNFSLNGIGSDLEHITELDKFAHNTIGKELEDLAAVCSALKNGVLCSEIDIIQKTGLIGHSRGGATAILYCDQSDDIECLITWASLARFDCYLARRNEWRTNGFIPVENVQTNQILRLDIDFLNDLERQYRSRDILKAESRHGVPHLIIHGYQDKTVSYSDAQDLFEASSKSITGLDILPRADHTFGITHPFAGSTPVFDSIINKTIEWLKMYLYL